MFRATGRSARDYLGRTGIPCRPAGRSAQESLGRIGSPDLSRLGIQCPLQIDVEHLTMQPFRYRNLRLVLRFEGDHCDDPRPDRQYDAPSHSLDVASAPAVHAIKVQAATLEQARDHQRVARRTVSMYDVRLRLFAPGWISSEDNIIFR